MSKLPYYASNLLLRLRSQKSRLQLCPEYKKPRAQLPLHPTQKKDKTTYLSASVEIHGSFGIHLTCHLPLHFPQSPHNRQNDLAAELPRSVGFRSFGLTREKRAHC